MLIDLSKAGILAQLALSGKTHDEVIENISRGMEVFGPAISLDTIVETLVISVGTLSGVFRLEILCSFAIMSVIVNYVVFMTFYPALLSLIMDLSKNGAQEKFIDTKIISVIFEDDQKPNPVVQRVKIIMSTGLMIVHLCSRFVFSNGHHGTSKTAEQFEINTINLIQQNATEKMDLTEHIMKWLKVSSDQIVILILLVALLVKFVFFEERFELNELRTTTATTLIAASTKQLPEQKLSTQNSIRYEKSIQTDKLARIEEKIFTNDSDSESEIDENDTTQRSIKECIDIMNKDGAEKLTDCELLKLIRSGGGHCPLYKIESIVDNPIRGVKLRRNLIAKNANLPMDKMNQLSYKNFDYTRVMNSCCENVLGYVEIPVGYAGPLRLDGKTYYIPMATTEGALVASTNRGCKVISIKGVSSFVEDIGMTRAPCVKFPNVYRASQCKRWIDAPENYLKIKVAFDSTSRFARLQEILITMDGPQLYVRFRALTGDAMGMNMVSKGCEMALRYIHTVFPDMNIISLSGNFCSDKKPAAINWIKGRGKRVVCESIVSANDLRTILKTDAKTLVQCNKLKNMAGSAMAGSVGGNNAHAANMVTAIYIACGQDPAQNVTSSNCSTGMELCGDNMDDLYITCTMPSLEVGTVGGGTGLPGQGACLDMLGVRGAHLTCPAENSKTLAKVVCAAVLAGEISLMAALVNSDLVKSHMRHNR